jgi:hypothetical protein
VPYWQARGRRPFERASKIAHAEIINNPLVQQFVEGCQVPAPPPAADLKKKVISLPDGSNRISSVIAIDGGLSETWVRDEFPSASIAFLTFGPLLLHLEDLDALDREPFISPEDMSRLKNIDRYSLVVPTRLVRADPELGFAAGFRKTVHEFLMEDGAHLAKALAWLLFREWREELKRESWAIPQCPNPSCWEKEIRFYSGDPLEKSCSRCGQPIYLADALRLYERVDEEQGAGGVLAYLLSALEQIVLVYLIQSIWDMKPSLLEEVLFVRDGPLAFFGTTAPLRKPMRDLVKFLAESGSESPLLNLVGLEKTGEFVQHAALIEDELEPGELLILDSDYVYKHIVPGSSSSGVFGGNTYYGAKVVVKGDAQDTYVATIPTVGLKKSPSLDDLLNAPEVLHTVLRLRCSMYDNALVPVVLANRLVSLAEVPSSEILKKFARQAMTDSA